MSKIGEFYHSSNFHLIHFYIFTCCTSLNELDYVQKLKLKFILQIFHCIKKKGSVFLVSDHAYFKNPFVAMKIFSIAYFSDRVVIICIHAENDNKTKGNFQSEQTEVLKRSGVNIKGRKQEQNKFNR